MKMRWFALLLLVLVPLALVGCSDVNDTDSGGVSLIVDEVDGLPIRVSVNGSGGAVVIEDVSLRSIVQNPSAGSSDLQTIELRSYEVVYTRADTGTRVPEPLVRQTFGTVAPNGTLDIMNFPVMLSEQVLNPPLADLLVVNGGFDRETGSDVILMNLRMRIFGRTLGGRDVVSNTQSFTVEFVP